MGKTFDKFKKWVDDSTSKANEGAKNLNKKVKKEFNFYQTNGDLNEAYDNASYEYEIIGTSNWANKPKRIKGFLVEDDLKILFKIDENHQEYIVRNVLLKDVKDESIIQIDKVIRDEAVYLDLKVQNKVVPIGCFYASYKAKDIPDNPHNVVKVEEEEVVGTVHFKTKD